jgi:hypothetical protein
MAPIPSNTPDVRVVIVTVDDGTADRTADETGIAVVGPAAATMSPAPPAAAAAAAVSRLSCLLRFIASSSLMGR